MEKMEDINKTDFSNEALPENLVPDHIKNQINEEHNPQLAELFSEQAISQLSLDEFMQRVVEHGSGHFAIHRGKLNFLDLYLRHGYILPTGLTYSHAEAGRYEWRPPSHNERFIPSTALHFSVDRLYSGSFKRGVALVCPIETIVENKAVQGIPLEFIKSSDSEFGSEAVKNDMPVSGLDKDNLSEDRRFYIDKLGVLLIPKDLIAIREKDGTIRYLEDHENWNEEETPSITVEDHIEEIKKMGLPCPEKIFFYTGNLQSGVQQLFEHYKLEIAPPEQKIKISAPIKFKYRKGEYGTGLGYYSPSGKGDYYSIK